MLKFKLFTLLFCLPIFGFSQDNDLGNWLIYIGNKNLNNRWTWHSELQYRNHNFIGDTEQLLVRTGLGYNLTEGNNNLLLGYGFIHSEPYIAGSDFKASINEHRIYQQFITRQSFGRVALQHRYRFEQRFVNEDVRLRARYFLGSTIALNNTGMADKTLYLSLYNEVFLNLKENYFDRNRFYAGLGYKFNNRLRIGAGWMRQAVSNGAKDQLNFFAYVNL